MGGSMVFNCLGDCGICDLKFDTCPMWGSFKSKSDRQESGRPDQRPTMAILIANALKPKIEAMALDVLSPEVLYKRLESDIIRLAQAVEIIEESGGEITPEELAKDIYNLIPMDSFGHIGKRINNKLSKVIAVIAAKIIQACKRTCPDHGTACAGCYMESACTQRQKSR